MKIPESLPESSPPTNGTGAARASSPRDEQKSLINAGVLSATCGGAPLLFDKIVRGFQTHVAGHLADVGDAIRAKDAVRLRRSAHKLRGLVSAFSTTTARFIAEWEQVDAPPDFAAAAVRHGSVTEMIAAISLELRQLTVDDLRNRASESQP